MTPVSGARIVSRPDRRAGRPCIAGRRIAVVDIAFLSDAGEDVAGIIDAYPALTEADIEAALDYRHAHREEIDAELAEDEGWEEETERLRQAFLAARGSGGRSK